MALTTAGNQVVKLFKGMMYFKDIVSCFVSCSCACLNRNALTPCLSADIPHCFSRCCGSTVVFGFFFGFFWGWVGVAFVFTVQNGYFTLAVASLYLDEDRRLIVIGHSLRPKHDSAL